jgi:hypothetical protein
MSTRAMSVGGLLLLAGCSGDPQSGVTSADAGRDADSPRSETDTGTPPSGENPGAVNAGHSAYFPRGSFFLDDVYDSPKATYSDDAIASLRAAGGFGNGDRFQIDFSIDVLRADAQTTARSFTPRTEDNGFEYDEFYSPDCDESAVPLPADGNIEGEQDYVCRSDGDCHLIVFDDASHALYELWRVDIQGSTFAAGCLARWDTSKPVLPAGRGLQCTSADAAGFPIAPLLFTADEVAAGEIEHAIRFILPNDRVQRGFVPPATHGSNTTGGDEAPYYGVHLRLRRDYPLAQLPSEGARVVARALQRYGMYHADGGNIALTAQSDRHTTAKWEGLLAPRDLASLRVEDFEVVDHGAPIELTFDCRRTPSK